MIFTALCYVIWIAVVFVRIFLIIHLFLFRFFRFIIIRNPSTVAVLKWLEREWPLRLLWEVQLALTAAATIERAGVFQHQPSMHQLLFWSLQISEICHPIHLCATVEGSLRWWWKSKTWISPCSVFLCTEWYPEDIQWVNLK